MRETGELELASTITLVLQANRLTNCVKNLKIKFQQRGVKPKSNIRFKDIKANNCGKCLILLVVVLFIGEK